VKWVKLSMVVVYHVVSTQNHLTLLWVEVFLIHLSLLVSQAAEQHLFVLVWKLQADLDIGFHPSQQIRSNRVTQDTRTFVRRLHLSSCRYRQLSYLSDTHQLSPQSTATSLHVSTEIYSPGKRYAHTGWCKKVGHLPALSQKDITELSPNTDWFSLSAENLGEFVTKSSIIILPHRKHVTTLSSEFCGI